MKIITWNIGGGFISKDNTGNFDEENLDYFIEEIKNFDPEIICLQETHISKKINQPKEIAKKLGLRYFRAKKVSDSHLKNGEKLSITVLSKYPIIYSNFFYLPNPKLNFIWRGKKATSHDKGLLKVKIKYNKKTVSVFSAHMVPFRKFGRDFLEEEFVSIRNKIEKIILLEKIPTLFCADMNFGGDIKKLLPKVFEQKFNFVLKNTPTTPKGRTYDKIIVSKDWSLNTSKIKKGKADHYLCFADLYLIK